MKEARHHKGSFHNDAEYFGHRLTGDHLTSQAENMLGIGLAKDALVIKDLYTGLIHLYPTVDKSTDTTVASIQHFVGDSVVTKLYSDNSGEISKALKRLQVMHHTSQPGVPMNNAVIERVNQDVLEGTRTVLVRAGLPVCVWPFAAEYYCIIENSRLRTDAEWGPNVAKPGVAQPARAGEPGPLSTEFAAAPGVNAGGERTSPWFWRHLEEFPAERLPFGCKVLYLPSSTKQVPRHKMDGKARVGIFAGYELAPGYKWSKLYFVWDLEVATQRFRHFWNV